MKEVPEDVQQEGAIQNNYFTRSKKKHPDEYEESQKFYRLVDCWSGGKEDIFEILPLDLGN